MSEIQAGDQVNLKSSSPLMTVRRLSDDGQEATCEWFDKTDVKSHTFKTISLKKHTPMSPEDMMRMISGK